MMSSMSRTNRWTSRLVVVLQLATWSAVSIVLLHKGINSLQRRMLEANHVAEWSNGDLNIKRIENKTGQSIDKDANIVIPIVPESPSGNNWSRFTLSVNKSAPKESFEIVTRERSSASLQSDPSSPSENWTRDSTGDRDTQNFRTGINHLPQVEEHNTGGKKMPNKILQAIRGGFINEREETAKIVHRQDTADPREQARLVSKIEENRDAAVETLDFANIASQFAASDSSKWTSASRNKSDLRVSTADTFWKRKDGTSFRQVSTGGAAMAIAMVIIGTLMLLVGPAVIILRLLDEMRRTRESRNELSTIAVPDEDLPPAYEQVVLINEEAPRYSTLALSGLLGVHSSSSSLPLR